METLNKTGLRKINLKNCIIILLIAIFLELIIIFYNFCIEKIFSKLNFIGNNSIEIGQESIAFEKTEGDYNYYIFDLDRIKVHNILLKLNKEYNDNLYLRAIINNDEKLIAKSNSNGTEFNVYYLESVETDNVTLIFPKDKLNVNNIEKVVVNSNLEFFNKEKISLFRIFIFYILILACYFAKLYYRRIIEKINKVKFEMLILIFSIVFGILFVFINVPLAKYDEHAHFWRAYEISLGNIRSDYNTKFPKSIINLFFDEKGSYPNRDFDYDTLKEKLNVKLESDDTTNISIGVVGSYSIINYLPSAIGIFITRIFNFKPMVIFYIGRIFNLISYCIVTYFAVRIVPVKKYKKIFGMITIFPMSLILAASYSPDAIIISFSLLAVAYILKLKYDCNIKEIKLKHIVLFSIFAIIPTICKIVYLFLFALIFLIPKSKFKNKYGRKLYVVLVLVLFLLSYYIFGIFLKGKADAPIEKNVVEQFLYIISDPLNAGIILLNTLVEKLSDYISMLFGGWDMPTFLSYFLFVVLVCITFEKNNENEKYTLNKKDRLILLSISILQISAIFAALWLDWSTAKSPIILGIQGRYFIPTVFILLLGLDFSLFNIEIKNKRFKWLLLMVIVNILTIYKNICTFM